MAYSYPILALVKNGRSLSRVATEDLNEASIPYAIEAEANDPQIKGEFRALKVYYTPETELNMEEYICRLDGAAGFTSLERYYDCISVDYKAITAPTSIHINPANISKKEYVPAHNRTDVYVDCNGIDDKIFSFEGNLTASGDILYATYGGYGASVGLQESLLELKEDQLNYDYPDCLMFVALTNNPVTSLKLEKQEGPVGGKPYYIGTPLDPLADPVYLYWTGPNNFYGFGTWVVDIDLTLPALSLENTTSNPEGVYTGSGGFKILITENTDCSDGTSNTENLRQGANLFEVGVDGPQDSQVETGELL
jgi:hypothetical protein